MGYRLRNEALLSEKNNRGFTDRSRALPRTRIICCQCVGDFAVIFTAQKSGSRNREPLGKS
ncbi:MAG: hypothetical protein CMI16_04790 [Opitutaceae bacterium]|nr:hypothetical protein [Opitutaceae bacterium]